MNDVIDRRGRGDNEHQSGHDWILVWDGVGPSYL